MLRSVDITEKEKRLFKKFILLSHSLVSLTVFDKLKKKKLTGRSTKHYRWKLFQLTKKYSVNKMILSNILRCSVSSYVLTHKWKFLKRKFILPMTHHFDGNFHFEKQFTIPLLKLTLRVRTKTVQNKFFFYLLY